MKSFLVSIGLVLVIQYACASSYLRHFSRGSSHGSSPFDHEEDMCDVDHRDECVPLVVRPRDVPKPSISVPVLNPIAGPCGYKKAIVKPAVIPKPVYLSSHSQSSNVQHHTASSGCKSNTLISYGGSSGPSDSSGSSTYISGSSDGCGTYVTGGNTRTYVSGNNYINQGTPADAVSLNLAYKLARQQYAQYAQCEDKLAFGFKKLPTEVPQKRVVKTNIPEEQIYSLNGQIVELKPVSISSQKSLDEEAAEDLLAMEAEEHAIEMEQTPIKKLYLEEIGYGPAKAKSAQFVDIPVSETIVHGDATSCSSSSSSSHVSGCGCCKSSKCKEYLPGNVQYKVVPKVDDIVIPLPEPEDSCESAEINISHEDESRGCECQCHCTPLCVQTSHNRQHKKSSVFIQKYQH